MSEMITGGYQRREGRDVSKSSSEVGETRRKYGLDVQDKE